MTKADLLDEFDRLCREGTKEEVMAFHLKHGHQLLEEIQYLDRTSHNPKKEN
jgi:hypothetical protein